MSDNVIHENEFESKNESSDTDSDLDIPSNCIFINYRAKLE